MKWLKKTAAVILMILAALGLLICAAGFAGAIAVNAPLSNSAVLTIGTAEGYVSAVNQTTGRIREGVASLQEDVSRVQQELNGTEITDASVLRRLISQIATDEIRPGIESLIVTTRSIIEGLLSFNTGLVALNQIPGVSLPTISEELEAAGARFEALRGDIEEIQSHLSTSQDIKNRLLQPVNRLAASLDQAESSLAEGESKITEMQTSLASLRLTITRLIDLASLALVIVFLLFGAGQVLLFDRAWKWFKSISIARSNELPGAGGDETLGPGEEITHGGAIR